MICISFSLIIIAVTIIMILKLNIKNIVIMLSTGQEIFKFAIEGKLRVQSRASERLHHQIIEEMKEMEHKRTEEAMELVRKGNDWWRSQNEEEEA